MVNPHESLLHGFAEVSFETWKAEVERALQGAKVETKLVTRTLEGIDVKPLYVASDWPWAEDAAGFAGAPPYRRGDLALGRHDATWAAWPSFEHPDPDVLASEAKAELARGAKALVVNFDGDVRGGRCRATAPRSAGARGVPCVSAAQLEQLLSGVPLPETTLVLDAGGNGLAVAACLLAVAERLSVRAAQLDAWLGVDPLGALARDGELPCSLDAARAQLSALATFATERAPGLRAAVVSTVPHHDAGAHAAQEIGIALATGVTYLRWLTEAGLRVEQACAQLAFRFAVGSDFFMEIAKLRAMRQCWASVVAACGGGAEAQRCTIHAVTSARTKTARDPWVNMLRETTEAFAAAVGGADAITTAGFDRRSGPSDAFARRIASNLQVVLDEEAHVTRVADAGGGAFYVESLTDALARRGWEVLQSLEREGGMHVALASGRLAGLIGETATAREQLLEKRKQPITGVSEFASVAEEALVRDEPSWAKIEADRARLLASAPDDGSATRALVDAVRAGHGAIDAAIRAAAAGATLQQLSAALGGGSEPARMIALPPRPHAAAYERLRDACDAYATKTGERPSVFLCNVGPIPQHKARAQYASSFFAAGGLRVIDNDGFDGADAAAEAFATSGARLCVICGSDASYPDFVPAAAKLLAARGAVRVVVAGRPGEQESTYRAAGASDFIYVGCNVVQTLRSLLQALGVTP